MDAHLGIEPSPFASEAAVLETACATIHQWAIQKTSTKSTKIGGVEENCTLTHKALLAKQLQSLHSGTTPFVRSASCFRKKPFLLNRDWPNSSQLKSTFRCKASCWQTKSAHFLLSPIRQMKLTTSSAAHNRSQLFCQLLARFASSKVLSIKLSSTIKFQRAIFALLKRNVYIHSALHIVSKLRSLLTKTFQLFCRLNIEQLFFHQADQHFVDKHIVSKS